MVDFIIRIIIPLLCMVITYYFVPHLKVAITVLKEKNLYNAAVIAVQAAEQIYKQSGTGQLKFEYVKEWIKGKFNVSDEDLKNIIESAVFELNRLSGKG